MVIFAGSDLANMSWRVWYSPGFLWNSAYALLTSWFLVCKKCWQYLLMYQKSSTWVVCRRRYGYCIMKRNKKIKWPYLRLHTTHVLDFWYSNRYCLHLSSYQKWGRWVVRRRSFKRRPANIIPSMTYLPDQARRLLPGLKLINN